MNGVIVTFQPILTNMKKLLLIIFLMPCFSAWAQMPDSVYVKKHYDKMEVQIPMRDGVKLFTAIYIPKDKSKNVSNADAAHVLQRGALWC